jgi:hypothetical protein
LAHLRRKTPQNGLFAAIFWLRQKDFRFNPLRPTGFSRYAQLRSA